MKRRRILFAGILILIIIIVAACSPAQTARQKADNVTQNLATQMAPPTPTRASDIAYAVETFTIEKVSYTFTNAWLMDEEYCQGGFPTPGWVSSHSTEIKLGAGVQITVKLDTQSTDLHADIEVTPSDLVSATDWEIMFHSGVLSMNRSITIAIKRGEETNYHTVVNCGIDMVSK